MPNWAVVIGVDKYAAPSLNLKGAVRDALHMAEFLTGGDEPLVEPARLKLLLSSTDDSPKVPASLGAVSLLPATLANIVEAFSDVAKKPSGKLFVHFSGHGLMAPGITGGEAILPEDYQPSLPIFSIRLDGIRDFLRTSKFDEQIYFIDACRNTPLPQNFNIGQFPITPEPKDMRPQVQQFVFCATLRGVTANEDRRVANDERGVFTAPLLRGLRGEGRAKIFDEDQEQYLVTTGRLLRFVKEQVRKTLNELQVPALPDVQELQEPRLIGEIGETETVILSLAPAQVPEVKLRLNLTPPEAAAIAKVIVAADDSTLVNPPIVDKDVPLPPRDYRVQVRADGFVGEKKSWRTELYEDTRLTLAMTPGTPPPEKTVRGRGAPGAVASGALKVSSTDSLGLVQIVDSRGTILASRKESATASGLRAGIYRGRLVATDGTSIEQVVDIDEGASESVTIEAPPPPSLLACSTDSSMFRPTEGRPTPVIDVLAVMDRTYRPVNAEIQPLDGGKHFSSHTVLPSSGHYLVSLDADGLPINVALPALDGWITRLTLDRRENAQRFSSVQLQEAGGTEPQLERLEAAQRYFQNGLFDAAADLIAGEVEGPMALLLEAYALLRVIQTTRSGSVERTRAIRRRLQLRALTLGTDYVTLSDSALLQAELTPPAGRDQAIDHCKIALDLGLPLFAFGTLRLTQLVNELGIDHPRRALLERAAAKKIPGWLWTAWS